MRVLIGAFLALVLAGCSGGGDATPDPQSPAILSGRWAYQVQATSTTCTGLGVPSTVEDGYLVITQAGSAIGVEHLDACGKLVYAASGSVSGSVAILEDNLRSCSSPPCCYDLVTRETFTLSGSTLEGDVRLTMTATDCGTTDTPCDYSGTIAATRCPPGACQSYPPTCP